MPSSPQDDATIRPPSKQRKREAAPAQIRVVYPPEVCCVFTLGTDPLVIGRKPAEGTPLMHPTVSRRHLTVRWDKASWQHVAVDLGSQNDTWIDGAKLSEGETALTDGAVVRVGEVLAVYEQGADLVATDLQRVSREAIPGEAGKTRKLRAAVARSAADPSPVLLVGETGTGKEFIAQEIHRLSERTGPLKAINCAELSEQLTESQLFGHERGAFTKAERARRGLFRAAHKGTLFLDEIGELPLPLQPKLLRVLQEGQVLPVGATASIEVNVRVVAATNVDLRARVEEGGFRRDLYARLSPWEIEVPSLRQRRVDIVDWIGRLHERWLAARPKSSSTPPLFDADAIEVMLLHSWPNNLHEVDRLVHQLASREQSEGPVSDDELREYLLPDDAQTGD